MTADYKNGIISLVAENEVVEDNRLAISHITIFSPTNTGLVEISDSVGRSLCKVHLNHQYSPNVTVPIDRTVDGVKMFQHTTGAEALVYLKRG